MLSLVEERTRFLIYGMINKKFISLGLKITILGNHFSITLN